MNPDVLLNRIRLEQRGLIDIHKKLYEMEHLLPVPDPMQFAKTAESAALLSEKSTAHPCGDFRRGVFHHGAGSGMGLDR